MRKSFFAMTSLLAMSVATAATAADLPRRNDVPTIVAVPVYSWTGFYVGLNAGYGFGEVRSTGSAILPGNWNLPFAATIPNELTGTVKPNGFVGGAHVGYNYQFNALVLGIEADAMYHDQKASRTAGNPFFAGQIQPFTATGEIEWSASIRARLGFAIDRLLIYGTGGVAFGQVKYNSNFRFPVDGSPISGHTLGLSSNRTGYVVGGGLEYAVTNNFLVRAEYLYYDFGSLSGTTVNPFFAAVQATQQTAKFTNNVVRAGISYKF